MVAYRSRGHLYYVCAAKAYRKALGCGPSLRARKEEIEDAIVEELGHLFNSWLDTKRLTRLVNE